MPFPARSAGQPERPAAGESISFTIPRFAFKWTQLTQVSYSGPHPTPCKRRQSQIRRRSPVMLRLEVRLPQRRNARPHHSRHAGRHTRRILKHGYGMASKCAISLGDLALGRRDRERQDQHHPTHLLEQMARLCGACDPQPRREEADPAVCKVCD